MVQSILLFLSGILFFMVGQLIDCQGIDRYVYSDL